MSDGFFNYPGFPEKPVKTAADLKKIKAGKPETLKWIDDQVSQGDIGVIQEQRCIRETVLRR